MRNGDMFLVNIQYTNYYKLCNRIHKQNNNDFKKNC